MRLRVERIELIGAEREYTFGPGLNLITGPITVGKTTLIRCIQGLLGSNLGNMPREAVKTISNLAGKLVIDATTFQIVRPFVTTSTARVDLAGDGEGERLPALQPTEDEPTTYGQWLLQRLELPVLRVPRAPSNPDGETVPLSINDFMMYCYLQQDEIDNSVFGHTDTFRNIKRRYVFEVLYGKYSVEVAELQEQRATAIRDLRRLQNQASNVEDFLAGTSFSNQATLREELALVERALQVIADQSISMASQASTIADTEGLKDRLRFRDEELEELKRKLQFEVRSAGQKESLAAQLKAQSIRLTKAIVAGNLMVDFDFVTCPRCGSSVDASRTADDICYLCGQEPEPQVSREALIQEQDRLSRQIAETRQLISTHMASSEAIEKRISELNLERLVIVREINYRTQGYVSEQAEQIAHIERERTTLIERRSKFREYLELYGKLHDSATRQAELQLTIEGLDAANSAASTGLAAFNERVSYLEEKFREALEIIQVPSFSDSGITNIDRTTYMPILQGRRFETLQSQGLQVMVNVAHAVAHQLTAMHYDLPLPNYLMIDGLSANIGYEGLDAERINSMYQLLFNLAEEHGDRLQIIVTDNTVPSDYKDFVRVEFTNDNKLIPEHLILKP